LTTLDTPNVSATEGMAHHQLSSLKSTLVALDTVVLQAVAIGSFDIVGRAFSTMLLLIEDIAAKRTHGQTRAKGSQREESNKYDRGNK